MFTKKHFEFTAAMLKDLRMDASQDTPYIDKLIEAFCVAFEKDNKGFKPERFKKAAGYDEPIGSVSGI